MMTSSNGNIFRITGTFCVNSPVTGKFPSQRPVTRNGWANNRDAGDLRRNHAHYDVTVMVSDSPDANAPDQDGGVITDDAVKNITPLLKGIICIFR